MGTDREGVVVGDPIAPDMFYEVERAFPPRRGFLGADYEVVHVYKFPEEGMRGIIANERYRRGIGELEQLVFRRVRTKI